MNQSSHWLCMVLMTTAVPVFAQEPEAVQVTLQDAIQRAVMVSPQIAQAEQNVVTANQSKRTAVGSFLPTISTGSGTAFICAGVESMSRIQRGGFNRSPHPNLESIYPEAYISMGITAENIASKEQIKREDQEIFAAWSHNKALHIANAPLKQV